MDDIEKKILDAGYVLPAPPASLANYVPFVVTGNLVFIAGQLPLVEGTAKFVGKVGADMTIEQGQEAARLCALNILAQLKSACGGDWSRVGRCVRLGGFVNCVDGFAQQPQVINGASDFMVRILGDRGRHARAAVGVNALPLGVAVEIDAVFEIA